MKRLFTALSCFVYWVTISAFGMNEIIDQTVFHERKTQFGDVEIKTSAKSVFENRNSSETSFVVTTPEDGLYDAYFWVMGSIDCNGDPIPYNVYINDIQIGKLQPIVADWQIAKLNREQPIYLKAGDNTVVVEGTLPDIPEVEFVNFTKVGALSSISDDKYNSYKLRINKMSNIENKLCYKGAHYASQYADPQTFTIDTITSGSILLPSTQEEDPLYDYFFDLDEEISYTFYKTVFFSSGSQIYVSTNTDMNFKHVLEIFSVNSPQSYSWSSLSDSNNEAYLSVSIPVSGLYYVRVRSYINRSHGTCNVNINDQYHYVNVPVFSYGLRTVLESGIKYNSFTCYSHQDPIMWMEVGQSLPGKVEDYNDNYYGRGTFAWGKNPRINKSFNSIVKSVLVTLKESYSPTDTLDIYTRCKNSNAYLYFENLNENDAIASSPASGMYNCISWSGGITSYWEWPLSPFSDYSIAATPLECFDLFYNSERYPGCSRYTRGGATEQNCVIDLWGHVNGSSISYTHASITKGADNNAHGYAWESKPGRLTRTFHPRYAVGGDEGYGQVVAHYRKLSPLGGISLEEAVANGDAVLEYNDFTEDEINFIEGRIESIPETTVSRFNLFWNEWESQILSSTASNPNELGDCQEYRSLLHFCLNNPDSKYLVYQKMQDGNFYITKLLGDLTVSSNQSILYYIFANNASNIYNDQGQTIVRSPFTNAMAYTKQLLAIDPSNNLARGRSEASNVVYSNDIDFDIMACNNTLNVHCFLTPNSNLEISVRTLDGRMLAMKSTKCLEDYFSQSFTIKYHGTVLVCLNINGHTNIKKIEL